MSTGGRERCLTTIVPVLQEEARGQAEAWAPAEAEAELEDVRDPVEVSVSEEAGDAEPDADLAEAFAGAGLTDRRPHTAALVQF